MLSPIFMRPKPLGLRLVAKSQQYMPLEGLGVNTFGWNAENWVGFWRIPASAWSVFFPGVYRIQISGGGGGGGSANWYGWAGEAGRRAALNETFVLLHRSQVIDVSKGGDGSSEYNDWTPSAGATSRFGSLTLAGGGSPGRNAPPGPGTDPRYDYWPAAGHTMRDGISGVGRGGQGGSTYSDPGSSGSSGRVIIDLVA